MKIYRQEHFWQTKIYHKGHLLSAFLAVKTPVTESTEICRR